jgi:hypothetical protein
VVKPIPPDVVTFTGFMRLADGSAWCEGGVICDSVHPAVLDSVGIGPSGKAGPVVGSYHPHLRWDAVTLTAQRWFVGGGVVCRPGRLRGEPAIECDNGRYRLLISRDHVGGDFEGDRSG